MSTARKGGDIEAHLLDSPTTDRHVPNRRRSDSIRKLRRGLRTCSPAVVWAYTSKILRLFLRGFIYFLIGSTAVSVFYALLMPIYSSPPLHYKRIYDLAQASDESGRANPANRKVFIASTQSNPDQIRGQWGKSLLALVDLLGPENVFVSIYENDSGPETPKALAELSDLLQCNRSIVTGSHVKLADLPQIEVPSGQHGVKKSEYLAHIRNKSLRPLDSASMRPNASQQQYGLVYATTEFDRVLFLDDVFFDPVDAVQLLFSTKANSQGNATYEAACAASFSSWGTFDGVDVVRDADGFSLGYPKFPWFSLAGSGRSRADVIAGRDAVRVRSCWGGLTAYDAKYFQIKSSRRFDADSGAGRIDHNANDGLLRFRSDNELFWDASETCLLQADLSRRYQALSGRDTEDWGVYLNPYVRVSKYKKSFSWLGVVRRFEHVFAPMQYSFTLLWMYPTHNERRGEIPGNSANRIQWFYFSPEYLQKDRGRDGAWLDKNVLVHPGSYCGMRQMSVMGLDFKSQKPHKMTDTMVFDPPPGWKRGWI